VIDEQNATILLGRQSKDIVDVILFLASVAVSFVTRRAWSIDGGRLAKLSLP
jgi:NAD(P)-dependent dehydrogenase (short-subunit alcohol dehydrogenase family)